MPARAMCSGARPLITSPAKLTVPLAGGAMPMIVFKVEDFPAPFRPSSAVTSPARTSRLTS